MLSRRDFIANSSLVLGAAALPARAGTRDARAAAGARLVEAQTTQGRVQGLETGGVQIFKGIPYGASTAGPQRFLPPRPAPAWRGVRACLEYGPICPQPLAPTRVELGSALGAIGAAAVMSEDCLNLNLWTPAVRGAVRRPVLVGLHGSGFVQGSANATVYDGAALARSGDVVVIGVNHRLGVLGYLQLADLGAPPAFARAGVAGLMDLVAALRWVRDNAVHFGGDPDTVMIYGQSGGGAKVSSLLATPAARGLFHRAAVQSGTLLRFATRERGTQRADALLRTLGAARAPVTALQALPWQRLVEAQTRIGPPHPLPVLDGSYLTHHPFEREAPEESAAIPLIISSTLEDAAGSPEEDALTEVSLQETLERRYAGQGSDILALYRRFYPDKSPTLIHAQVRTDAGLRRAALEQARLKAAQGRGAVYVYEWDWPGLGELRRFGAANGLDVPATYGEEGASADTRRLAGQLSSAWIAFARSGNPACAPLPPWPGYDVTTRATLVFGTPTQMINDPRGEIRRYWQQMPWADEVRPA